MERFWNQFWLHSRNVSVDVLEDSRNYERRLIYKPARFILDKWVFLLDLITRIIYLYSHNYFDCIAKNCRMKYLNSSRLRSHCY